MNCRRVQALLPLHAGADLAARESEGVRIHLETCAACRTLAEEFAASGAWLQAAPPPEFDEAFLAALRADVQQAIAQTESKPIWVERWLPVLNWRWAWAPVLALILLAIALNWQRQRALPNAQPPQTLAGRASGQAKPPAPPEHERPTPELNHFAVGPGTRHKQVRGSRFPRNDVAPLQELTARGESPQPKVAAVGESMLAATPVMTRIEIQTADPNIRIIWLISKPQDATNPAEIPNR